MVLMTGAAFDRIHSVSIRPTVNLHRVTVAVVTLTRKISHRVTVHTARVTKHRDNLFKRGCGCGIVTLRSLS
jgi:hypothetical protein